MIGTQDDAGAARQGARPLPVDGFAAARGASPTGLRGALPAFAAALVLSACVPPDPPRASTAEAPAPRYATYRCDGDSEITIEDFRTSVHVVDAGSVDVELPAAPPDQTTRYGQPGYALILEKGTALWMVTGKRPVNCRRGSGPA